MNEPQQLEHHEANEVASLIVPMANKQLLLPNVTVAEMVSYREPKRNPEAPDWYLGDIEWRDQIVPVVCYEVMNGEAMPSYDNTCRIAILNNTGVDDSLPFFGVATQGIPRLSRVKADEIHQQTDASLKRFDLMSVSHAGEFMVIPNVTALEQAFLDYRATRS